MLRISADECKHMDMEWYGVDRQDNIAVFYSGGEGNLSEFVCESEEKADELITHSDKFEKIISSIIISLKTRIGRAEQIARNLSDKGLYYFDVDNSAKLGICTFREYYTKHSVPQNPLKYELLSKYVREVLKHNFMEIGDFSLVDTIRVKHTYI